MTVRGAILDLDGTVYRGDALLPGADDGIATLRERGVSVLFVSNKAIERRERYAETLGRLGVPCEPADVVTSATVTADFLARNHPERVCYVVGEEPLRDQLRDVGLAVTDNPDETTAIVASMDREFDYAALSDALDAMDDETVFVATNPDRTCPVADGEIPDAAGMVGAIEGVTGRELDRVMGKPSETMLNTAMDKLDLDPAECLLVGDRLETDVEMGNRAGMTTVLVLTGVTDRTDLDGASTRPDYVIDSLGAIGEILPQI
ncbi:HAD-IIA family hydrolase [Halorussus salinisoli]|uniref:HAD-IIA family hydrolase n=1 Tax=Halorussus salinisoli TaxID=2558242 RepID=UPI0010C1DA2B|nr:HAD-IIA family hydrolase [Halorussus salinisoli]